jgi:four helix bundle protein
MNKLKINNMNRIDKLNDNLILKLSFEFAIKVTAYTEQLESLKRFNMANQLFRSATSIGANANEAQSAESKNDFIHKIKIADKEANETWYWLMLCNSIGSYPACEELLIDVEGILKVLGKIISSSKS